MTRVEGWDRKPLGEVLTLKRGYDLPSRLRTPGPVPVVSSSGVTGSHNEAKVTAPGVVTGRYGTLGKVFFMDRDFWPLNTTLYVEDFQGTDPRFANYFLQTIGVERYSGASAVPGVDRNVLHRIDVDVPPVSTQRKIAGVLSLYDHLIDNNTRRIETLKEMAQAIYREWFVNFRFPGHKDVELVESELGPIPEGWEVRKLGEVMELSYGKGLRKADRVDGEIPVYGSSGVIDSHNEALVEGPGIVVGRKGNVGSVYWVQGGFCPIDTTYYVVTDLPLRYVYFDLQYQGFVNSDAAVPGLNRNQAYSLPFLVPPLGLTERFDVMVAKMFEMIRALQRINGVLSEARDLLLPKLISGEIDVTDLDIDTSGLPEWRAA